MFVTIQTTGGVTVTYVVNDPQSLIGLFNKCGQLGETLDKISASPNPSEYSGFIEQFSKKISSKKFQEDKDKNKWTDAAWAIEVEILKKYPPSTPLQIQIESIAGKEKPKKESAVVDPKPKKASFKKLRLKPSDSVSSPSTPSTLSTSSNVSGFLSASILASSQQTLFSQSFVSQKGFASSPKALAEFVKESLSLTQRVELTLQILKAVKVEQQKDTWLHGELTLSNILVSGGTVSIQISQKPQKMSPPFSDNNTLYAPIEKLQDMLHLTELDEKSDVYSVGVIAAKVWQDSEFLGREGQDAPKLRLDYASRNKKPNLGIQGLESGQKKEVEALLKGMMSPEKSARPTLDEAIAQFESLRTRLSPEPFSSGSGSPSFL